MKLNLRLEGQADINNYVNIDPVIHDLDHVVEDNEAVEILAEDILDFFPTNKCAETINRWLKKLRHGGKIIVGGVDLEEVCFAVTNRQINIFQANNFLYGDHRRSCHSPTLIMDYFSQLKLKVLKVRWAGHSDLAKRQFHYFVEGERE